MRLHIRGWALAWIAQQSILTNLWCLHDLVGKDTVGVCVCVWTPFQFQMRNLMHEMLWCMSVILFGDDPTVLQG
jgi:hypothetical protein